MSKEQFEPLDNLDSSKHLAHLQYVNIISRGSLTSQSQSKDPVNFLIVNTAVHQKLTDAFGQFLSLEVVILDNMVANQQKVSESLQRIRVFFGYFSGLTISLPVAKHHFVFFLELLRAQIRSQE